MSDLREKQPATREVDLTRDSYGTYTWEAKIGVWPYSSIKSENVYARDVTILFHATSIREAHGFAQSISTMLSLAHDVWQTNLNAIRQVSP